MKEDILEDVRIKYEKKNKILFSRDSKCLQGLLDLIRKQKHRTIVMWAFISIEDIYNELIKKYPNEDRLERGISLCKAWSRGDIKMPVAKKALLDIHAIAKEIDNPYDIALFHAIGQGCATVHVETHAIGLVMYELTAIVLKYGIDNCEEAILSKINKYIINLKLCEKEIINNKDKWASFLLNDDVPNKEMELLKKKEGIK